MEGAAEKVKREAKDAKETELDVSGPVQAKDKAAGKGRLAPYPPSQVANREGDATLKV